MGQKVHPFGFRVGITEAHKSRWYAPKALYGELLVEDQKIRDYCDKRLNRRPPFAAASDVHIERTREELKVIIKTARPGIVIGPKGSEIDLLTQDLQELTGRNVSIHCLEIPQPGPGRQADRRVHRRAAQETRQLPPHHEDEGRRDHDRGSQGREDPAIRPTRRSRDEP